MFSFLSASVSYDNLTNLLAAMSIYYLISFQIKREGGYLVKSILCQLCGCLTKTSFLPLAAILTVLLIGLEIKNLRVTARSIKSYIQTKTISAAGLVITTAIALLLNIQLYGGNYYKYSSIAPEMQQVISTEAAMQNRIAARNIIFSLFRDGKISLEEAESMASRIKHPTDRTDAVNLVNNYADFFSSGAAAIGPASYIGWWIPLMAGSIFGIKAHLGMANRFDIVFALLMLLSIVSFFFRCRETINRLLASMLIIALSYTGFIYFTVNYDSYLHFKDVMASVSGRYCFPVLGPIYILATFYLLRLFRNTTVRGIIAVSVAVLFISLDFPYFLAHATPEWYSEPFSSSFLVALFR
jgi:hypothetical protein